MMGKPGCGKGTQAQLLVQKIGGHVFSSGGELRSLAASDHYLGRRLKGAMEAGEILPYWLGLFVVEQEIFRHEPDETIVAEGACRTEREAIMFHEIAQWLSRPYLAINLNVSDEETVKRLVLRKQIEGRADDDEAAVRTRVEEYVKKTAAGIEYFRSQGRLLEVNGEQSIEDVHKEVCTVLNIA